MTIWWLTITLRETVYVIGRGGGWTTVLDRYAEASTAEQAMETAHAHYAARGLPAERIAARPAQQQDKGRYAFPEQIIVWYEDGAA
jgi:hypothetical protein